MNAIYGKLATKAVETAAKQSEKNLTQVQNGNGDSAFKQMLNEMDTGKDFAQALGIGKDMGLGNGHMEVISAGDVNFKPEDMNVGLEEPKGAEKIVDMLSEVNKGQLQMDNMVNEILYSGKKFSNQELLAIQAHVFHFAQMTELTVKVAEHGVGSVKQVLNTQVQ